MQKTTTPKIGFISLGCPKALIDSETLINILAKEGYQIVASFNEADLVIINTCGFINEAIQESLATIADALKQHGKVMITGCMGAAQHQKLLRQKYPKLLHISGPNETDQLLKALHNYLPPPVNSTILKPGQSVDRNLRLTPEHYAYLKIAEGCNNQCSFCIIPKLRGKLHSRSPRSIMQEAEKLVAGGTKELIVIAQDTLAYGSDLRGQNVKLLNLVKQLSKLGVWLRLHYLYPYPKLDELLPLMAQGKILPYLDVPLQHVNRRILKLMRRPGSKQKLLERIQNWRRLCPNLTIRSSFIVGFPGETEKEFNELIEFLKIARLDHVGAFKYSDVAGAAANKLPKQLSETIKNRRLRKLMLTQQQISATNLKQIVGKTLEVIIDDIKPTTKIAIARGMGDAPNIDGKVIINLTSATKKLRPGEIIKVVIKDSDSYDLYGGL